LLKSKKLTLKLPEVTIQFLVPSEPDLTARQRLKILKKNSRLQD
jgi:hypothetical protein